LQEPLSYFGPHGTSLNTSRGIEPAYSLRFTWTGWPTAGSLPAIPSLNLVKPLWENDGLRLLEQTASPKEAKLLFSTLPEVSAVRVAQRAKGRLQYFLRNASKAFRGFSKKIALRSIGENTREQVERYIDGQVGNARFVDPSFEALLRKFTICCPEVDLTQPSESARGRYWYNLHLVLVVAERGPIRDPKCLARIRDGCFAIAQKKDHRIAMLSVMPDHLHMALRGNIEHSPQEIALAFQNNLAYLLGQVPIWRPGFYAGTFSEYDMGAIRAHVRRS